jgi:hypothetical protein
MKKDCLFKGKIGENIDYFYAKQTQFKANFKSYLAKMGHHE